jgi:2,3-bisphosphoglycerate-independent phosphoglycerate mutase
MKEKAVLIVCDGLGDRQINGKTPLQMARKPNMDKLAEKGICGLMHTIAPGIIPGSDTGHLSIFGYDPNVYYKGRGVYEALGAGLELKRGDVAFRGNFATVDKELKVADRRAGRLKDEGKEFEKSLAGIKIDDVEVIFKSTTEHRGVLVFRGSGLSSKISDTDPHADGAKVLSSKPLEESREARKTSDILNRFTLLSHKLLSENHLNEAREKQGKPKANIILVRGAGSYKRVDSLYERYGFKSACISGGALYKGVAKAVGMDVIEVKGATGRTDTDVDAKARAAKDALEKYDLVFVHVKGMDNASHDGNLGDKVKMIEKVDRLVGGLMKSGAYLILTGDHSTPVSLREHSADPLPIVIYGKGVRVDDVKKFDEISCAKGGLGHIRGLDVMPIIVSFMGYAKKFGE